MENNNNEKKGALWVKTAKTGLKYMGGEVTIDGVKYFISVFKNTKKSAEKQPDYNIVVNLPNENYKNKEVNPQFADDDDIPF